jgi:uncharacterized protein
MIAHTELASSDPAITKRFLEQVFNWHFQNVDDPKAAIIPYYTPGGSQGSIRKTNPNEPPVSMSYILVDNLSDVEKKILNSGGEIVMPRVDVPEMGSFFWFRVPGGPILACWQDAPSRDH